MGKAKDKGGRMVVRRSPIHGRGVFALRDIPKGTRLIEYRGEQISDDEAVARYPEIMDGENHTFVFEVGENVNIDGGSGGNIARWVNHACTPNCETIDDEGRIFIESIRRIRAGEELTYDYNIDAGERITPSVKRRWPCRCGHTRCRGTVLVRAAKS